MNYIVLDLEWNQGSKKEEEGQSSLPFEIIEIGAVKLNQKRSVVSTFHRIIKPKVHKELHSITKEIVQMKEEDLNLGVDFVDMIEDFALWCGKDYSFCTWGPTDLLELQRNLDYFKAPSKLKLNRPLYYYDVQYLFSLAYEEEIQQRTLEYAVHYLDITVERQFHSALNDAVYTAEVFARINPNLAKKNFSVDTYRFPRTQEEEIRITFSEYSLYVTRAFPTKEELKEDKNIMLISCNRCDRRTKRVIPWFSINMKTTVAVGCCKEHGYFCAKLLIKNPEENVYYGVRTIRAITENEVEELEMRKEERREKRKEKRHRSGEN